MKIKDQCILVDQTELPAHLVIRGKDGKLTICRLLPSKRGKSGAFLNSASPIEEQAIRNRLGHK